MSGGNSVYSPLPQSNSDSDEFSEEELHSLNERQRVISRLAKLQNQAKPEVIINGRKPKITNYKQLDNDRELGITLNGFQLGADEITVSKPNDKVEKFSTSRKICFTFSIFFCVFTTVVFLWVLPCEIGSCPPDVVNSLKKVLYDIELHGPIRLVPNARDNSHNLIFLCRKSFNGETNKTKKPSGGSGIISLLGGSKKVSWFIFPEREPKDIDCDVIDVDLDGVNDCLVVGEKKLFKAIEPLSGKELWDVECQKSCDFDFPLVLPDLDGDHVKELLSVCTTQFSAKEKTVLQNYFVLISGKTGKVINQPMEIPHCTSVHNLMFEKEYLISYTCLDFVNTESLKTLPLRDIAPSINPSLLGVQRLNLSEYRRHQHKNEEVNLFYVDGRHLRFENKGQCPDKCSLTVTVKDEKSGKNNQNLWSMESHGSYGMVPVIMKFEKCSGFVFKYWKWENGKVNNEGLPNNSGTSKNDPNEEGEKVISRMPRLRDPKLLENELYKGDLQRFTRCKRMLTKRFPNGNEMEGSVFKEKDFTFHKIIERVVLITFNETDMHSVNASQSEIIQICKNSVNCQPDAQYQKYSLLINDIDNDNLQELISLSSTYVNRFEEDSTIDDIRWQLQSTIQVIRLEAELPKLYKSKN